MMKMKELAVGLSLLALVFSAPSAGAQAVVFDPSNYAQALKQVTAWQQQYQQMASQLQQLKGQYTQAQQQYAALTGTRNLGQIANNPLLANVVPADVAGVLTSLNAGGYTNLTNDAKILRQATLIYNCEDRAGTDRTACEAALNGTSQEQAYGQNALSLLAQREQQIETLQGQINATQDPKAIADLQARLAVTQAQTQNDTNRINVMASMAGAQQAAAQQALKERTLKRLSASAPATADTFQFQLPSQ